MTDTDRRALITVSLLALPESTPAALYGLYEVFVSVGLVWPNLTGQDSQGPRFAVSIVSPDGKPFKSAIGTPIEPHAALDDVHTSDIVIVADLSLEPDGDPRGRWKEACDWVRGQHTRGALICSICTGSVLLADTGLLDGHEATTHWSACELFPVFYPAVRLQAERIIVPCGKDHRVITSGGASAWEDLVLYLIARYCDQAEAVRTAKVFLFGDRSEGQLPYAVAGPPRRHDDAVIAQTQTWIADHYKAAQPVSRMAARSRLPERSFKRRFKVATGYTPVAYVQTLRIEEAKQLLETTDDATDEIGRQVGYEDPTFFRRLFRRHTGTTPARYRRRYKSIGQSAELR